MSPDEIHLRALAQRVWDLGRDADLVEARMHGATDAEEGLQQEQLLKEAYLKLPEEFFTLAREIEDIGASTWLPCWVQEASGYRDDVAWDARSDAERDEE
jgi:hypothetical protein